MSLLDKVSILISPNGYKAGTLYAAIPNDGTADMDVTRSTTATRVDENGLVNYAEIVSDTEEVTNGDFDTDLSGWVLNGVNATNTITWESNGARILSLGTNISLQQQNILTVGVTYKLTCNVTITNGKIGLDASTSGTTVNLVEGFNEIIFTASSVSLAFKRVTGNDNCLIDNVSAKEVTRENVPVIDYADGGCPHILVDGDTYERDGIGSLINSTEGVLFVEMAALSNDGTSRRISLSDGSVSNRVSLELDEDTNKIKAFISLNGISQILEYTATNLLQFNKIAIKWKVNDFAIWFNGIEVTTDSSGDVPTGMNRLSFTAGPTSHKFDGKVKQLHVYKEALTDTELTNLTTLTPVYGCTNPAATNYNANANTDDGSCVLPAFSNVNSIEFDGTTSFMTVPNNTNYKTTAAISCFAWVKLPDWNVFTAMTFFSTFRAQGGFMVGYANKRLTTTLRIGSSSKTIQGGYNKLRIGGTQGTATGWHMIGFTFDGEFIKTYVDGVVDTSNGSGIIDLGSTGNVIDYNTGSLNIGLHVGAQYTTSILMNGSHDDMATWSNALTDAEVLAVYNSGVVMDVSADSGNYTSASNLTGWWRMGDGDTLPTITDHSTNSNDGTTLNVVAGDISTDVPS